MTLSRSFSLPTGPFYTTCTSCKGPFKEPVQLK